MAGSIANFNGSADWNGNYIVVSNTATADTLNYSGGNLEIRSNGILNVTHLNFSYGTIGVLGGTLNAATLTSVDRQPYLAGFGIVNADLVGYFRIVTGYNASVVVDHPTLKINGSLAQATGYIQFGADHGTLELASSTDFNLPVDFGFNPNTPNISNTSETLKLDVASKFHGAMTNFSSGDFLDLADVTASSVAYNNTTHVLTVNRTGSTALSYSLTGSLDGYVATSTADSSGGTLIHFVSGSQPVYQPAATFAIPISAIQSIGLSPDGQYLLIKVGGVTQTVATGSSLDFNGSTVTTADLTNTIAPIPVFKSSGGDHGLTLPELFAGPASLHLQYQLIETADNAVVIGGSSNDFIKVASTNSTGKAVDGGGGSDVIDGGVGSTFVSGGTSHSGSTFFLDGRAPGVSWSTITDFKTGSDQATIWGFVKGVSSVDTTFTDPNYEGAGGIYSGLTLHFKNLLPDGQATGTNAALNSITLSGHTLADIGAASLQDLNNQIDHAAYNATTSQYTVNSHLLIGQTQDTAGTHGYLFVH